MLAKIYKLLGDLSIKYKLLLTYIILILLPFLIYMFVNTYITSKETERQARYSAEQILAQTKSFLEYKIDLIKNILTMVAVNSSVKELIELDSEKYKDNMGLWRFDMDNVQYQFIQLQPNSDTAKIRLYLNGSVTDISETETFLNMKKVENASWYHKATSKKSYLEWFPAGTFPENDIPKYITAVRKITSEQDYQQLIGLIRIDMPEEEIRYTLDKAKYTGSSSVFLLNTNNEVICISTNNSIAVSEMISIAEQIKIPGDSQNAIWSTIGQKDKKALVGLMNIKGTDWRLILSIPYNDIVLLIKQARSQMIIIILSIMIVLMLVSLYAASSVTKKFRILISHMRKAESGNFNVSILPSNNDEIGQLTRNFNHMLTKIAILLEDKYKMGQDIKAKELKALQAQINPHFLYNTLDQIYWMAMRSDEHEIGSIILNMSKFYKLSLSKGEEMVTLENELEHVKMYVQIQNVRFNNSIKLIISVQYDLYQYKVPKILLQPIVENSILHGILEKDSESGIIRIGGELKEGILELFVQDDGIGMSHEMTQDILNISNTKEYHGYGIKNINERLHLLYGSEYGLSYESLEQYGTTVRIRIPIISW